MTTRIDEMRATGEALDTALVGARRFVARAERHGPERLVLVVDDDADTRELYTVGLAGLGFHVETARDGVEGVARAITLEPDVIVLDFAMPTMDGGQAALLLAEDPRTRGIPILMLSAFADLIPRDVRLGCAAFLAKPCTPQDLGALLHLIIAARSTFASSPSR